MVVLSHAHSPETEASLTGPIRRRDHRPVWEEAFQKEPDTKHPLAPLIAAWQSGPVEVSPVKDADGHLRGDTIAPRIMMRDSDNASADRIYLPPAHICSDGSDGQIVVPSFCERKGTSRILMLPVDLYDLGVQAGARRGGNGEAPTSARLLVKLAAAPSASVRSAFRRPSTVTCHFDPVPRFRRERHPK